MQFLSLICLNGSDFGSAIELDHHYKIPFQLWGKLFALSKMTDWTINIALRRVQIDYYNLLHPAIDEEKPPQFWNDCLNKEKKQCIWKAKSVADGQVSTKFKEKKQ